MIEFILGTGFGLVVGLIVAFLVWRNNRLLIQDIISRLDAKLPK